MGFWPFGGKKSKLPEASSEYQAEKSTLGDPEKMGRSNSGQRRNTDRSGKALQNPKDRPFTPQPVPVSSNTSSRHVATSSRDSAAARRMSSRQSNYSYEKGVFRQNPLSQSSLGPENFNVLRALPTLYARRGDKDVTPPRTKSSKRKAEERAREREVRAMSSPIPIPRRPLTYSAGPMQREVKKIPGDFSRPSSQVSLPLPEPLSERDSLSAQNSFTISAFAILSPRPKIRYESNARTSTGKRVESNRTPAQQMIAEEDFSPKMRIDKLADNLDSSGLRELMERDQKRRERKKESDKRKLERKLQQRAEKQAEDSPRLSRYSRPSTPLRERVASSPGPGYLSDQLDSSPLAGYDDPAYDHVRAQSAASWILGPSWDTAPTRDPFEDPRAGPSQPQKTGKPLKTERDLDALQDPFAHDDDDLASEPVLPVRSPLRNQSPGPEPVGPSGQALVPPPHTSFSRAEDRSSLSQASALGREPSSDIPEKTELNQDVSGQAAQGLGSWTDFFKRGSKQKRASVDRGQNEPSEFANTSRESFARQQPPPVVPPRSFKRSASGIPQRTRSKFREDLPESPQSPPDSAVESRETPTVEDPTTAAPPAATQPSPSIAEVMDEKALATNSSIPILDRARQEKRLSQRHSIDMQSTEGGPSAAELSQSLASVDSEGSWLSGRPVKRSSVQMGHPLRQSQSSLKPILGAGAGDEEGGDEIAHDEYFNRLSLAPDDSRRDSAGSAMRKASSTAIPLQGEREASPPPDVPPLPGKKDETLPAAAEAPDALISKSGEAAQSTDDLQKPVQTDEEDSSGGSDDLLTPGVEAALDAEPEYKVSPLMRATSVEYKGGHGRQISAGSAKLMDIRRSSMASTSTQGTEKSPGLTRGPSLKRADEPKVTE